MSLAPDKIRDFGDTLYKLKQAEASKDGHHIVEHEELLKELRRVVKEEDREQRARALQALRYATARREGLVSWVFDASNVARKDIIQWASSRIQAYFTKVQ